MKAKTIEALEKVVIKNEPLSEEDQGILNLGLMIFRAEYAPEESKATPEEIELFLYRMLAKASMTTDKGEAWKIMRNAMKLSLNLSKRDYFTELYSATARSIVADDEKHEFYCHNLFDQAFPLIFGGIIAEVAHNGKDIPDRWVLFKTGELAPVEIKKNKFDKAALDQLKRYITAYKCDHGIAVARELKVPLPSNIYFIPLSELEEALFKKEENNG